MPQDILKKPFGIIVSVILLFLYNGCKSDNQSEEITREQLLSEAPMLTPEEFIQFTNIEEGFELQLVAAEPEVSTPVAMVFDERNRIWVVEMEGYMPNVDGEGEDVPNGKVVILEDKNQDGSFESRTLFLDSLVLPRAIALVEQGVLVVEPPSLWYYEIKDDQPGKKTLVDPKFTKGGNVEAQANGLFRAMDNWIYSGGSDKRYKKVGKEWRIEKTHLRGQWGITQDDVGRLYYNNNSQNLLGDYFLPGLGKNNKNLKRVKGYNERIVSDNSTYPSRPTPGVNRGYMENVLDDSLRLKSFTAACGPVIYRADLFDESYYQNAFVAEPAANLIKRNILSFDKTELEGKQAYKGKEFIASDDERFRPVSLYNGPDGALYIVDMYRGIIQHKTFITQYLKGEVKERGLEAPLNAGRIYKVVPKGSKSEMEPLSQDPHELVKLFKSKNSWKREKAQQLLIDRDSKEVILTLKRNLNNGASFLQFTHSLWTLEGLGALTPQELIDILKNGEEDRKMQALAVMDSHVKEENYKVFAREMQDCILNERLAPYVAFQLHLIDQFDEQLANQLRFQLLDTHVESSVIVDALLANLEGKESTFAKAVEERAVQSDGPMLARIRHVETHIENQLKNKDSKNLRKIYGRGISVFKSTCQACHGSDGEGIESLAPPLNRSEWVTGDKNKLIAMVLFGVTGPIEVNGKLYQVPEISGEMPGIVNDPDLVDTDLALLLSYIRKTWNNEGSEVSREDIVKIKKRFKGREEPFTAKELHAW